MPRSLVLIFFVIFFGPPARAQRAGRLDKLTVQRDVQNAVVEVSGKLGKVVVGGNLVDNRPPAPAPHGICHSAPKSARSAYV